MNEDEILNGVETELAGLDTAPAVPEMPTLNLSLSLSDEDLEGSESQYKHIPAGTRTDFRVYSITQEPHEKNGVNTVKWAVILEAVSDEWGPGKKVREFLRFTPQESFRWGPFLKAIGAIEGAGSVDMSIFQGEKHKDFEDVIVSAKVMGYSWKGEGFPRSYGKGAKPIPQDGTAYFEDLGYYQRAEVRQESGGESDGLSEFDPTSYL